MILVLSFDLCIFLFDHVLCTLVRDKFYPPTHTHTLVAFETCTAYVESGLEYLMD